MNKHTPGPWRVLGMSGNVRLVRNDLGLDLAMVYSLADGRDNAARELEADANARLIAAAPDLFEACQQAIDYIDGPYAPAIGMIVQDNLVANAYVALSQVLESARAATSKATGVTASPRRARSTGPRPRRSPGLLVRACSFVLHQRAFVGALRLCIHAGVQRLLDAKKFTSVTAAERGIEFDEEYMAHRQQERDAVAHRILMEGKLAAAKLRARLAVEISGDVPSRPSYVGIVKYGHVDLPEEFPDGSQVEVRVTQTFRERLGA